MNIALTGIPLFFFVLFSFTVALFSLIVGLIVGLFSAVSISLKVVSTSLIRPLTLDSQVIFTVTCVGIALSMVFPAIFFTTMAATFFWLWGMGGYYILRWANGSSSSSNANTPSSSDDENNDTVGDKLNAVSGGRLTGMVEDAKHGQAKGDIKGYNDEHTKPDPPLEESQEDEHGAEPEPEQHQQQNGSAQKKKDSASHAIGDATKRAASPAQKATKATESASKTGSTAAGAVKGGAGGATGLT